MIKVVFYKKNELISGFNELISGFDIKGHATIDENDFEGSLVCSAVSSAAIMTANTVTEIIGDLSDIEVDDGALSLRCADAEKCNTILQGLVLHLCDLEQQYPEKISIITKTE